MINRIIELPSKSSFFLFGPRQTGKSTLIKSIFTKNAWVVDLLDNDLFLQYSKYPSQFHEEAAKKIEQGVTTIFIDEIQRVPVLLNEVQILMGKSKCQFILTGSSARKLKRGGVNLLGGRALLCHLFPFAFKEIKSSFSLEKALLYGTLPALHGLTDEEKAGILKSYVTVYLTQEIQAESIVRNLAGFSKFLDMAAAQFGELVNFSSVGRDCYLPVKTVQSYYEILEDTLIGFRLEPWRKSMRRRLSGHPKFYLFDNGVTNAINRRLTGGTDPVYMGRLFEQWIVLETYRAMHYSQSEARIYYWRTNHGAEVDLVIEKHGKVTHAFEIKSSSNISGAHLSGLRSFREEYPDAMHGLVCMARNEFDLDGVHILPWREYLELLEKIF